MRSKILMVVIPDRISDIVNKGEIVDRYYNPGEVFDEVHIVMTNNDNVDASLVQKTVGAAKLYLHNVGAGKKLFLASLAWRPFLLKKWAGEMVDLARKINPDLIRCYGAHLNAYAAHVIKQELNIPYLVSLHTNPRESLKVTVGANLDIVMALALRKIEKIGLQNADLVMPVYKSIIPYLEQLGVNRYQVCYNVLNPENLFRKNSYSLSDPVRVVSVGRQIQGKNPTNLILAVGQLRGVHLTLIGDGPCHENLRNLVKIKGLEDRVSFYRAVENDTLCKSLFTYDLFAVHTEYAEISKSVLESLLTGLPLVINKRGGAAVPELSADICVLVENKVSAYKAAIGNLVANDVEREALGRRAYAYAQQHWAAEAAEAKFSHIHQQFALC